MNRPLLLGVSLVVLLLPHSGATAGATQPKEAPAASLSKTAVDAKGRQESILTVARFGRYAVKAASTQGTAVQVVSRMVGPGEVMGTPGEVNGRVDGFFDRGDYKVVALSHELGRGKAALSAHAFTELNAPEPPLLVELKPIQGGLDDLEQISYWLQIDERRTVALEAAGRNLVDLRLWKDGSWLVDATPEITTVQPVLGRPLTVCRLTPQLEPGLYLLSAYGGPSQPWAEQSKEHPFHLRFGIPRLPSAGRARFEVGPLGYDRWLVPAPANFFRIELSEARPAKMTVAAWSADAPFPTGGETGEILKTSLPPVAELQSSGSGVTGTFQMVTVTAPAGQPYILQQFERNWMYGFRGDGRFWVSSLHAGHAEDSIDATAIVTQSRDDGSTYRMEPYVTSVIELDSAKSWTRKFNLLGTTTLFVRFAQKGAWEIVAKGADVKGQYKIEPFLTNRPSRYESPPFKNSGERWEVDAGWHIVTMAPIQKGIVELTLKPVAGFFGGATAATAPTVLAAAQFESLSLERNRSYTMYLNEQPGVAAGAIVRSLPLDLGDALPVAQVPGQTVGVPFASAEEGILRARTEDGTLLDVSVDGAAPAKGQRVKPGSHVAKVEWQGDPQGNAKVKRTIRYSLGLEPVRLSREAPLPALPDTSKNLLPNFTVLGEGAPRFLDLERTASATFLLKADKPGLFQLQSTGLLATEGTLRTRTIPAFDRQALNGVGRNFLVQQYLREGDYQVTVSARDRSKGHLGVVLARTKMIDAGELGDGIPARVSVPAGDAVVYRFTIAKKGTYALKSFGLGKTFRCRLEDADGWPLVAPNGAADLTFPFEPGGYRLVVLPEPVATRQVTRLDRIVEAPTFTGHGPHALTLDLCVQHQWLEPAEGQPRTPDAWSFELPAEVETRVILSNEMEGRLVRTVATGAREEYDVVPPMRGWRGTLPAGKWTLETTCVRPNNRVTYQVCVKPVPLVSGLARRMEAPSSIGVVVGKPSLVELSSFGSADVRARLLDASGSLVAKDDDRPDDWNFHIARPLAAGRYTLELDPVGSSNGSAVVSMNVPEEIAQPALPVSARMDVKPGSGVLVYPLDVPAGADLVAVSARAQETVGIAVERDAGTAGWIAAGAHVGRDAHLEVPVPRGTKPGSLRLRVWSVDRRGNPIALRVASIAAAKVEEGALARGASLDRVPGFEPAIGVASIVLERPGVFRIDGDAARVRWSAAPNAAAGGTQDGLLVAGGRMLILVVEASGKSDPKLTAKRVTLGPDDRDGISLVAPSATEPITVDLDAGKSAGPVVLLASSRNAQPGARIGEAGATSPAPDAARMTVGLRSAVAVALDAKKPVASVWAATASPDAMETRLRAHRFATPKVDALMDGGRAEGSLDAKTPARAYELPRGTKRIHLSADESTVAVLSDGAEVLGTFWGGEVALDETVETPATRLTLLHLGNGGRFQAQMLPLDGAPRTPPMTSAASFERAFAESGTFRLPVGAPGSAATLRVRGASAEDAVLLGADGSVARGEDLAVPAGGGTLLLRHGAGWSLAWLDRADGTGAGLWGGGKVPRADKVQAPAVVALDESVETLRFEAKGDAVLHLRGAAPAVVRVARDGEAKPRVDLHAGGIALDVPVKAGTTEITLRALGGAPLWGTVSITTTPVVALGEGLGPEALLAAGDTRWFSFVVPKNGPVGVGVRTESDAVSATLLDANGKRVGAGVVQMPDLAAGTYLLAVRLAAEASPARVRPAIAGLTVPDTGPPEDVKRTFVQTPEDGAASFSATRVSGSRMPARGTVNTPSYPDTENGSGSESESESEGDGEGESESGDEGGEGEYEGD